MKTLLKLQIASLFVLIFGAALLYVPYAPFIQFDPFEYPKALLFIVVTSIVSALSLIHFIFDKGKFRLKRIPTEIKLLGFVVLASLLAFAFSSDHLSSLLGAPYRFQGLLAELTVVIYLLNVVYVFTRTKDSVHKKFFTWMVVIAALTSLLALTPYFFELQLISLSNFTGRVYGAFGNPNYLALFLIGAIPMFALIFASKSKAIKVVFWAMLAVVVLTLFLTGSRSAWIGILLGLFVAAVLVVIKKKRFKLLISIVSVILVSMGVLIFQHYSDSKVFDRFSLKEESLGSLNTRVYLTEAGLKLFLNHPVFGSGQETIAGNIEPYLPEYLKSNDYFYIDRTHNEVIDIMVTQGVIGLAAFIVFWVYLLWNAAKFYLRKNVFKNIHTESAFLFSIASIIAIHIYQLMNFSTVSGNILLFTFAGYLIARRNARET